MGKKRKKRLTASEAAAAGAGAGDGGPARRGADGAGAPATGARASWAKVPATRAITRTNSVTNLNIWNFRGKEGRKREKREAEGLNWDER